MYTKKISVFLLSIVMLLTVFSLAMIASANDDVDDSTGCTPGYWRQSHHFGNWETHTPDDLYSDVFGVEYDGTLLDAVTARGGKKNALARHSVAALLNAASSNVDYAYSADQIIAAVQDAYATGKYNATKDTLVDENESGCGLGRVQETPDDTTSTNDPATDSNPAAKLKSTEEPENPTSDSTGCTPGYWKQRHHFINWVGYSPDDLYGDIFGVDYDGTLLDALRARGGGANALARHSTAALLNAANGGVTYEFSADEIIAAVQDAYASGEYEAAKDTFVFENESGCDLGRTLAPTPAPTEIPDIVQD